MLSVILPAAGKSTRMQGQDKLLAFLGGMPVLAHSLRFFESAPECGEIILVTDNEQLRAIARQYAPTKLIACVSGGESRAHSVYAGLQAASGDMLCIHDAARPNLSNEDFTAVLAAAEQHGAAILGTPAYDTVKTVQDGIIKENLPRESIFLAQTPQICRREWLEQSFAEGGFEATDEASLLAAAGFDIYAVCGSRANFKLTVAEDMRIMKALYAESRIGSGFDAHRLTEGRKLILGGVHIPFEKGLLGHSDADVLLHALCDALLGAAAFGDIGKHFPDSDEQYAGISSRLLLERTAKLVYSSGFRLANADMTVIAQRPKLAPYIEQMRQNIAAVLGVELNRISVKATTTEQLGFCGRGEGIAAQASCLLYK